MGPSVWLHVLDIRSGAQPVIAAARDCKGEDSSNAWWLRINGRGTSRGAADGCGLLVGRAMRALISVSPVQAAGSCTSSRSCGSGHSAAVLSQPPP